MRKERQHGGNRALRTLRWALVVILPFAAFGYWFYRFEKTVSIEDLIDPDTRLRAFHRLWMDSDDATVDMWEPLRDWRQFQKYHKSIEMLECPQGAGEESLYLIFRQRAYHLWDLKGPASPWSSWKRARDPVRWGEWWTNRTVDISTVAHPLISPSLTRLNDPVIEMVDHRGKLVHRPFDGNNMSQGILFDVNRDGYIERVDTTTYGGFKPEGVPDRPQDEFNPEVLKVVRVKRTQEYLFSAIINLNPIDSENNSSWRYECIDTDGDGFIEIVIGPGNKGTPVSPRVVFAWDDERTTYVERNRPDGEPRPYWILDHHQDVGKTLKYLYESGKLAEYWRTLDRE